MAAYLHAGFDFERIGAVAVDLTDSGGPWSVRRTEGTYCHTDISSVESGYTDFASRFESDADASSTDGVTVSFSAWSGYTVTNASANNITLDFDTTTPAEGARLAALLGFSAAHPDASASGTVFQLSGQSEYTSDITPRFQLDLSRDGVTSYSRPYEKPGQLKRQMSTKGNAYSIGPRTYEKHLDFRIAFQTLASVHALEAAAAAPWTYEDLLEHARAWEPILLHTDTIDDVYKNREPEFTREARKPVWDNYHAKWHLEVRGQYLGSL